MSFVSISVPSGSGFLNPGGTIFSCGGASSPSVVLISSGALKLSSQDLILSSAGKDSCSIFGSSSPPWIVGINLLTSYPAVPPTRALKVCLPYF